MLYSGVALVVTLLVTIPAGYALAMTNFRFRRALLISTLMVMLIPNTALVLPIFLELNAVRLVGTPLAVILPFSFFPFGVYLTYIYFSTSVSRDLLDAARIDGAGEFRVFRRIAMPLATPVIALVGFFNFVGNWNNYFLPFIMQPGSRKMPVQVGLAELLSNTPVFNPTNVASLTISLSQLALATLISVAPVLIVFMFSQRFLVRGPHRRRDKGVGPQGRTQGVGTRSARRPADFKSRQSPPGIDQANMAIDSSSCLGVRAPTTTDRTAGWPNGNWIAAAAIGTSWRRQIASMARACSSLDAPTGW